MQSIESQQEEEDQEANSSDQQPASEEEAAHEQEGKAQGNKQKHKMSEEEKQVQLSRTIFVGNVPLIQPLKKLEKVYIVMANTNNKAFKATVHTIWCN